MVAVSDPRRALDPEQLKKIARGIERLSLDNPTTVPGTLPVTLDRMYVIPSATEAYELARRIADAKEAGNKIAAIKLIRLELFSGLRWAKQFFEYLQTLKVEDLKVAAILEATNPIMALDAAITTTPSIPTPTHIRKADVEYALARVATFEDWEHLDPETIVMVANAIDKYS